MSVDKQYKIPSDLYYSKSHFWAKKRQNSWLIGVTDYGQQMLRVVDFVKLPETGSLVDAGEAMGAIETAKVAADIISPFSGHVLEVNTRLQENPGMLNWNPYGDGWIAAVRPINLHYDLANLMGPDSYQAYLRELILDKRSILRFIKRPVYRLKYVV